MTTFPFEKFIQLVAFDQECNKHEQQIATERQELQSLQAKKELQQQELDALRQGVHDAQKEVDAQELEMKSLDERESELKKKLDILSNIKEYEPLKKELDGVHQEQLALEETLITAWNRLESSQRTQQQKDPLVKQEIAKAEETFHEKEKNILSLQEQLAQKMNERADRLEGIPEEWIERYEGMRSRVSDPVVQVLQGGCGGCFYTIPNQDILRMKKKIMLQCKDCYRFLYDPTVVHSDLSTGA